MEPLVSCILPAANHGAFVPHAIGHFLRQDYAHKDLVILNDVDDSVADLAPDDPAVAGPWAGNGKRSRSSL
jgi:hypothetical protein